jgi:hypothetical protein
LRRSFRASSGSWAVGPPDRPRWRCARVSCAVAAHLAGRPCRRKPISLR